MTEIYKKKARPISTTIKLILAIALVCFQVKICYAQLYGTDIIIRYFNISLGIAKFIVVLYIINKFQSPSYKLLWIIAMVFFPIPTFILYLILGDTEIPQSYKRKLDEENKRKLEFLKKDDKVYDELKKIDKIRYNQANYLSKTTGLPLYRNSSIEYYNIGEKYFEAIMEDISNAKEYIFIDIFSISEGTMWNKFFELLKQKKSEGVRIYLITDDMINSERYPEKFKEKLNKAGIEYRLFNPISLHINSYLNYRDHRKIIVIDSKIAYTGGINIGDQYINLYPKFGHWKDVGVRIVGEAVQSYIVLFISMWNSSSDDNKLSYKSYINMIEETKGSGKGYIMPYCDGPENISNPAQNLYIQVLNTAKDYVYITSPYLILDNEVVTALVNSAKSGVDVRIIIPFIPDKPFVHRVGKSFYNILLESGVKIYEYKPGFIHAKVFVSDDELSLVGTINLDFRGLYFHYECGNWIYKTGIESNIKEDFLKTQEKCMEITLKDWEKRSPDQKLLDKILITFSPLL